MDTAILTANQSGMLAIIDADQKLADSTKEQYKRALVRYWQAGGSVTDIAFLAQYARDLSKSGCAFLKAAIKKITRGIAHNVKANVTPETVDQASAALMRLEAIQETITTRTAKGKRVHTWLSEDEVSNLVASCGNGTKGTRDRVILGLLVGAGLRRDEAAELTFDAVKRVSVNGNGEARTLLNVRGKGAKDRAIPISEKLADLLTRWHAIVGDGRICRSFRRNGKLRDSISGVGIFHVVREHGAAIDRPELAPHDLRRTFAEIGRQRGIGLYQISLLLGHDSIQTTIQYLDLELNLEQTVSDFVPIG